MRLVPAGALLFLTLQTLSAETAQQAVDKIFASYNKPDSPGCAVGVIRDGRFVYRKGYGVASLELGVPLSSQSVFYLGSVSKQFTAAAVVLAAEQGSLALDDDVRRYIPELPDYGRAMTLRQLLHHTSGLRDFEVLLYLSGRDGSGLFSKDEILNLIARQKGLDNGPGDAYLYSNTNYFLLGEAVARATKQSLAAFAKKNIFEPLGMGHTLYFDDHTRVVPGRVAAYSSTDKGTFLVNWSLNWDIVGAGGVMSSVDDLLRWDRNFDRNVLGQGTLMKELQSYGRLNNGLRTEYAMGVELGTYRGLPTVQHDGVFGGYASAILRFPDQHFTVICLCNLASAVPHNFARQVADVYLQGSFRDAASEVPSAFGSIDPGRFAGKYLDTQRHIVYSFTASDGNLFAWGGKLRRIGPNRFNDFGTGIITFDDAGGSMKATLKMESGVFFAGTRVNEPRDSSTDLAAYIGLYRSSEIDAAYTVSTDGGQLMLQIGKGRRFALTAVAQDEFAGEALGTIQFQRDANHSISGLAVFTVNARGMAFERQ